MAVTITVTTAGRAALINAAHTGTDAVTIASVGLSETAVAATPASATLPGEFKRVTTIAGEVVADDTIHVAMEDASTDAYALRSFALYLDDGTLFALYGQADPILSKVAGSIGLMAVDLIFADSSATSITFGDTNFTNPPATTERQGVIEIATDAEAMALVDKLRALTPGGLAAVFTAANILSRLLTVDGAGSGLDADTVDGRHASELALLSGATFLGPLAAPRMDSSGFVRATGSNSPTAGAGVELLFDGTTGYIYSYDRGGSAWKPLLLRGSTVTLSPTAGPTSISSDLAVSGWITSGGNIVWNAGNDGSGSGLDADLLDGRHASEFALLSGATFTGPIFGAGISLTQGITAPLGFYLSATSYFGKPTPTLVDYTPDSGDTMRFDQAANQWDWYIDSNVKLSVRPSTVMVSDALNVGGALTQAGNQVWHLANDGSGSGLDADMLDGRQGNEFALLSGAAFGGPISSPNMMAETFATSTSLGRAYLQLVAGSAANTGFIEFRRADNTREGYIGYVPVGSAMPFVCENGAGFAFSGGLIARDGNRAWDAGTDGSGSGMDADMVDGWHRDDIRQWANLLGKPGTFPPSAHTHTAADIAAAFAGTLGPNGYIVLPGGLIFQWAAGSTMSAGTETTQFVAFPITFPSQCFRALASTNITASNIYGDALFQVVGNPGVNGATVMRQHLSSEADSVSSYPTIWAIGI